MTTQNGRAFNEWLRAQLKAKKMSQRQLAQQSGVDHSTISRLIRGDRMPSLGTATKLARGLRELRDDADTPQYLGLVAAGATNPTARVEYALRADELLERAAGPPDHGVLPRRPDAPLRPRLPAVRADDAPPPERTERALCAGRHGPVVAGVGRQAGDAGSAPSARSAVALGRTVRPVTGGRPGTGPLLALLQGTTRIALHRPGLGDSERRRLGRRRSQFRSGWRPDARSAAPAEAPAPRRADRKSLPVVRRRRDDPARRASLPRATRPRRRDRRQPGT